MKLLYPDLYLESIYNLDFDKLANKGIQGIITDLDNTLIAWKDEELTDYLNNWFQEAKSKKLEMCIVSNNQNSRVHKFAEKVGLPAIPNANKPRKKAFKKALQELELPPEKVAVVGDQVFTDVLGGNRMGMFTILVVPIDEKEFIGTKFLRLLERFILRKVSKQS
ncbi:YqeG family HAD IIIA-type phosphatase [Natranaerobius thermophilus]|uniref:HAD superfamily (Subfamily IIIA) phosphatase, TIGR01668 n=1 Tax=Natranaerobius thermophilus (strain ATCC BAA-1301 / DSM 18059 / JW/NM-WN-LF) TaxID=457570 RepID=B2A569_NATTJ|nr:YqeG family HAD IIIA-type phosphatase [Natranaerobius thermophilus]ACB85310.1 HAD superfamily (subfamily IIIA) phosphatase, TIGR01668 [Natranaerobius thermophilus JW/NM-WN-LF]